MEPNMLELLIAARDLLVAIVLSWMGITDDDAKKDKLEAKAPAVTAILVIG